MNRQVGETTCLYRDSTELQSCSSSIFLCRSKTLFSDKSQDPNWRTSTKRFRRELFRSRKFGRFLRRNRDTLCTLRPLTLIPWGKVFKTRRSTEVKFDIPESDIRQNSTQHKQIAGFVLIYCAAQLNVAAIRIFLDNLEDKMVIIPKKM
jgi:hypothetical protein